MGRDLILVLAVLLALAGSAGAEEEDWDWTDDVEYTREGGDIVVDVMKCAADMVSCANWQGFESATDCNVAAALCAVRMEDCLQGAIGVEAIRRGR